MLQAYTIEELREIVGMMAQGRTFGLDTAGAARYCASVKAEISRRELGGAA